MGNVFLSLISNYSPGRMLENSHRGVVEDTFNISRDFGLCVRMTANKSEEYYSLLVPSM